jgi:hypothetical protein
MLMSKFFQNSELKFVRAAGVFCGSLALVALMSLAPVVPAHAYVQAGVTRLDNPQSPDGAFAQVEPQQEKVRPHSRKNQTR